MMIDFNKINYIFRVYFLLSFLFIIFLTVSDNDMINNTNKKMLIPANSPKDWGKEGFESSKVQANYAKGSRKYKYLNFFCAHNNALSFLCTYMRQCF